MPKVEDYKKHQKSGAKKTEGKSSKKSAHGGHKKHAESTADEASKGPKTSSRRRPGHDESLEYVDTLKGSTDHVSDEISDEMQGPEEHGLHERGHHQGSDVDKVHIEFFGSELLRDKVPEVFDAAESIATEWKNNGDFENIDVPNPLLKQAATLGLQRAKKVEQKLEEKGVFLMARMGIELVKSKLKK